MAREGPVILSVAGDQFLDACRILAIVWEGATSAGDTAVLTARGTGSILWPGRAAGSHTYLDPNFGPDGLHCPNGFTLSQISAGRVCVYLREA